MSGRAVPKHSRFETIRTATSEAQLDYSSNDITARGYTHIP